MVVINRFFDTAVSWLSSWPTNPITDYLAGALMLVRRTLFNQAPTITPWATLHASPGPVKGSLADFRAVDAEGDELTYSVAQAPKYGTLTINPDGQYVYTPDGLYEKSAFSDDFFPVNDGFTLAVADDRFNLLDPSSTRSANIEVGVMWILGDESGVLRYST